jgi:hypothetical protein
MLAFTIKEKEISITVKKDLLRGTVGAKCKVKFEIYLNFALADFVANIDK